ncbi:MAG: hypothetical protein RLZZ398_430 [Verrucomicrobiota bacterium]
MDAPSLRNVHSATLARGFGKNMNEPKMICFAFSGDRLPFLKSPKAGELWAVRNEVIGNDFKNRPLQAPFWNRMTLEVDQSQNRIEIIQVWNAVRLETKVSRPDWWQPKKLPGFPVKPYSIVRSDENPSMRGFDIRLATFQ